MGDVDRHDHDVSRFIGGKRAGPPQQLCEPDISFDGDHGALSRDRITGEAEQPDIGADVPDRVSQFDENLKDGSQIAIERAASEFQIF